MSILSAQADGLRDLALWLDDEFYDVEASKVRQAADTILELRDYLQQTNDQNARLRKLCASLYEFAMSEYPDGTELDFADRMRELRIEVSE